MKLRILRTLASMLVGAALSASLPSGRTIPEAFMAEGAAPRGILQSVAAGPLPATERLHAWIGLPLRDPEGLATLRQQLHDPGSPFYHQWLSAEAFADRFGPSAEDYAKVVAWARAKGLEVTSTSPNRLVLTVAGLTPDLENAFGVRMLSYRHPSGRSFRSPDRIPTLDLDVAVATVGGLNDLARPVKRMARAVPRPRGGSGQDGSYLGSDLRKIYAVGVPSTVIGTGQGIAVFEFSDYYDVDITNYWSDAGMTTHPTVQRVLVDGGVTANSSNGNNVYFGQDEVAGDIEIAGAMAPGTNIYVYEGNDGTPILSRIVTDGLCRSVGVSWGWLSDGQTQSEPNLEVDPTQDAIFQEMDTAGIACFVASGDTGPWTSSQWDDVGTDPDFNPVNPSDVPTITCVGGTELTTTATGTYESEVPWNYTNSLGVGESTGGPSLRYLMATAPYQTSGIAWADIPGASTTMRNCPDVTANSDNYYVDEGDGQAEGVAGTSCSAPLWAGFIALVNQTSVEGGMGPIGNLNPLLYKVGTGSGYTTAFHDITSGNDGFAAQAGFDMASGWGSMVGQATIEALIAAGDVPPGISAQPQNASVTVGQPATFNVTATGTAPFTYQWSQNSTAIGGATSSSYTITATTLAENGNTFTVKVTNAYGSATSTAATLTVNAAPVAPTITTPPQSVTVQTNGSATFTVAATGTAPLSYQWYVNGEAVTGGTSATYTASAGASTNFTGVPVYVVVSNSVGPVTSATALLYIVAKPLDINGDGTVDVFDLAALASVYGQASTSSTLAAAADLDGDPTVDDLDITLWLAGFGGN